jgi:anti-sigma factor RsiW
VSAVKFCSRCGNHIPPDVEAVLTGAVEQGSRPGIPRWRHPDCAPLPWVSQDAPPQVGVRRAP